MVKNTVMNIVIIISILLLIIFSIQIDFFFPSPRTGLTQEDVAKQISPINTSRGTNPGAQIEIIEFADFSCFFCRQSYPELKRILGEYDINYVFKHLPSNDIGLRASIASECARDQGLFMEYHDSLFEAEDLSEETLLSIANGLDMDMEAFKTCVVSKEKESIITEDIHDAQNNGIAGTPVYIINGDKIEGSQSYESFKKIVEKQMNPEAIAKEILGG